MEPERLPRYNKTEQVRNRLKDIIPERRRWWWWYTHTRLYPKVSGL